MSEDRKGLIRRVFRLNRLIPFVTLLGAGVAVILSLLQILKVSLSEGIIISLLGLLAADALIERVGVLERLERALAAIRVGNTLRRRQEILPIQQHAAGASEICIVAISAISIAHANVHFFSDKVREGCAIRMILLNPKSPHLRTFDLQYGTATGEKSIAASLSAFEGVLQEESRGSFQIRLSEVFLPFSIVAIDPNTDHGSMIVEFYAFRKKVGERPHVHLTAADNSHWFRYFRDQFETAWSDSIVWPGNRVDRLSRDVEEDGISEGLTG